MALLSFAVFVLVPLAVCTLSRFSMFMSYTGKKPNAHEVAALVVPGASMDMLIVLGAFLVLNAVGYALDGIIDVRIPVWGACVAVSAVVILVNIVDAFIYQSAHSRIFAAVVKEMRIRNILVALSRDKKILIVCLIICLAFYARVAMPAFSYNPYSYCIAILFCMDFVFALRVTKIKTVDTASYVNQYGVSTHPYVLGLVRERLEHIKESAVVNLIKCIHAHIKDRKKCVYEIENLSSVEERSLKRFGMFEGKHYSNDVPESKSYSRIIMVCLESISQSMIPFYNSKIHPGTTPFINSLLENYPRLDRLYTSNAPTNEGLYAMHMSRLSYDYDIVHGNGLIDGLPTLLKEKGVRSYVLSGVTRHYGEKHTFFKNLLRYDTYLSEEDISRKIPSAPVCGWGIADSALYAAGLDILEQHRHDPVLLTIETANTHPDFFFSLPESAFPQHIRQSNSRILRSLYEMDMNLFTFFTALGKRGLFDDDTLILVVADHSPTHGQEYLQFAKGGSYLPDLIPCLFIAKDAAKNPFARLSRDTLCSQLDLLPTLIDGLGLRRVEHVMGASLFCGKNPLAVSKTMQSMRLKTAEADFFVSLDPATAKPFERCFTKWYHNMLVQPYMR